MQVKATSLFTIRQSPAENRRGCLSKSKKALPGAGFYDTLANPGYSKLFFIDFQVVIVANRSYLHCAT